MASISTHAWQPSGHAYILLLFQGVFFRFSSRQITVPTPRAGLRYGTTTAQMPPSYMIFTPHCHTILCLVCFCSKRHLGLLSKFRFSFSFRHAVTFAGISRSSVSITIMPTLLNTQPFATCGLLYWQQQRRILGDTNKGSTLYLSFPFRSRLFLL